MKKIDFIWLIEHISRELDVAAAVKILLKNKFAKTVEILPLNATSDFLKYEPLVVLLPYCYSIKDNAVKECLKVWPHALYINLSWEQIFYKANLEYKAPRDTFAKKFVLHHSWSNARKQFLIEKRVPHKNVFVNGNPAYALYIDPYKRIFPDKAAISKKLSLNKYKKWLFFPENYSWYFYSKENINEIIKSGQDQDVIHIMRGYCKKAFSKACQWLNTIVDECGQDFEVILRPRPAFSLTYFKTRLNKLFPGFSPKIHIIKDYSVREWILTSDIVVSSFSTSLIEAAIAGKPIAMLAPLKIPQELTAPWYKLTPKIASIEQFIQFLKKNPSDNSSLALRQFAKKEFLGKSDPIEGLVNFLGNLNKRSFSYIDDSEKAKLISELKKTKFNEKVKNALGKIKRKITDRNSYFSNDDQTKYYSEIENKINIFNNFFKK